MEILELTHVNLDVSGLDAEMRNQFAERLNGLTYWENEGLLHVNFYGTPSPTDETTVQALVDAHDPVFLTAERDGDNVTVTLTKPRNVDSATALTLTIDDVAAPEATALTDNAATVQIESADEITIGILEDYPHQEVTI